ncbi:CDP-diacylglycerol diphosphatase [Nostoc sp.]|uniref:CDP-diacylglycerol diphosphatase n=1 Tax=Nostoc sp. TaxID=1180 RepID=UPI002FF4D0E6
MKSNFLLKLLECKYLMNSFLINLGKSNIRKYRSKYLFLVFLTCFIELSLTTTSNSQMTENVPRDLLWNKVQKCITNQREIHKPDPCVYVDINNKYVVANGSKPVDYLLVPTDKISGIEAPQISQSNSRNYWQYAWKKATDKDYIRSKAPQVKYPEQIGLAINSKQARHQDQLHIHMSCIKKVVSEELEKGEKTREITDRFQSQKYVNLEGNNYSIRLLKNDSLSDYNNPFLLVKEFVGQTKMEEQSIAVVGRKQGGFYILNTQSDTQSGYKAVAEKLLDEDCSTQK